MKGSQNPMASTDVHGSNLVIQIVAKAGYPLANSMDIIETTGIISPVPLKSGIRTLREPTRPLQIRSINLLVAGNSLGVYIWTQVKQENNISVSRAIKFTNPSENESR